MIIATPYHIICNQVIPIQVRSSSSSSSMIMDGNNDNCCDASISIRGSISSSSSEDSMNSVSSSELGEDASSFSLSSSQSNGPLYKLSELMNHLPIRRGLSMFYQGKAESFSCLERVKSIDIENLAKKGSRSNRSDYKNNKSSPSYTRPKATISKKLRPSRRGSSFASLVTNKQTLAINTTTILHFCTQ